jgi:triacylglycerol lipase
VTTGSSAEDPGIERGVRALGARFDPDVLSRTRELYRTAVGKLAWADRPGVYDLMYGPEERNRLDVYPADAKDAPILVFFHGGGFVGGDKRSDPHFYGNIGRYFAEHGFLTILANYRLAPQSRWPAGNEDVEAVLEWVARNASLYAGNSDQLILVGQSAGAAHVAGYLFDPRFNGRDNRTIRGAALLSGFYSAKEGMLKGPLQYFSDDVLAWPDRSPASHVTAPHPPLLLSIAELDPADIAEQTLELAMILNSTDGRPPRIAWFDGHNHVSTVHGLGVGRDSVGRALRDFAALCLRRPEDAEQPA